MDLSKQITITKGFVKKLSWGLALTFTAGVAAGVYCPRPSVGDFKCVSGGGKYGGDKGDILFVFEMEANPDKKGSQGIMYVVAGAKASVNPVAKDNFLVAVNYKLPIMEGAGAIGAIETDPNKGICQLKFARSSEIGIVQANWESFKGSLQLGH